MKNRDRSILPIDETGNGERLRTLTYDFADAAMLYHAALIGANTVMMCAGGNAVNRMRYYQEKFRESCPEGYKHFRQEEDVANMAIAMMDAEKCTVTKVRTYSDSKEASLDVQIGKLKVYTFNLPLESVEEAISCIRQICPITCEITIEEKIERGW